MFVWGNTGFAPAQGRSTVRSVATRGMVLAASSMLLLHLAGCGDKKAPAPQAPTTSAAQGASTVHPQEWPAVKWPLPADPALESRVSELLGKMTLEEKVGQVIQGDLSTVTPDDVRTYHLGSVLNGGSSGPYGDDFAPAPKWLQLADEFYVASTDTSGGRAGIPVLWGTDAMHGHSNIIGATLFPHNIGLGAARNPELLAKIAAVTAKEIRVTGIDWTFAPTITVPQDVRWGRSYEGYSEDPRLVSSYADVFVIGLQGKPGDADFLRGEHVIGNAKHYLADGGTFEGRDQGDTRVPENVLRDVHGTPYVPAISAGVQVIMSSFSSWNGTKISGHRGLLTDVLKKRMDFQGFIIDDWNAHGQIPGCTNENCPIAINAGLDMYMAPDSWRGLYKNLLEQAKSGVIPAERLDDAVSRILRVKLRAGLFEAGLPSKRPLGGKFELIGHADHRALAREAVRESLVLLKNQEKLLPLKPAQRVLVAGDGADNLSKQAGGWTITWQGTGLENKHFPGGTSIWKGIESAVKAAGGKAELSVEGKYRQKPDVAIVVFGENPYAEFQGDIALVRLSEHNERHLEVIRKLREANIPVVAILLSGRPLWMNRELNASNAFVAAWLPGTEGGGVADVLFRNKDGAVAHDFKGRLSFSWPRTPNQAPLNVNLPKYDPLFKLGYGLRYSSDGNLQPLPEDPGTDASSSPVGVLFARGKLGSMWLLGYTDANGGVQPISTIPASVASDNLNVARVDGKAQEDSLKVNWSGKAPVGLIVHRQDPADFTRETNGDVLLVLTTRVDRKPTAAVEFSVACGPKCVATVPVEKALNDVPAGAWQRIGVPLKCFRDGGVEMGRVATGFALRTAGELEITFNDISLATDADTTVACAK